MSTQEKVRPEETQKEISVLAVLKTSSKRILKASSYVAALIDFLLVGRYFLLLILYPDNPLFSRTLVGLVALTVATFVWLFIALLILLYIIVAVGAMWRKHHRRVPAEGVQAEAQPLVTQPPVVATVAAAPAPRFTRTRLFTLIGGISGLVYLMYYVGRAYYDGFFKSLGVPASLVHFELQDYMYSGAQVDTIFITGAFTAVLVGLLITRIWTAEQNTPSNDWIVRVSAVGGTIYLVWNGLMLALFWYWWIFRPDLIIEKPVVLGILVTSIMILGILIMLLYFDRATFSQIRSGKIKSRIFIAAAIITLLFTPYMSAQAWGAYKAQIINPSDFPQVELYADQKLGDGIEWVPTDNAVYRSQELSLIAKTSDYIFLRASNSTGTVYVLRSSDILSMEILSLGKTQ